MIRHLDYTSLHCFHVIAEQGSLSRAALALQTHQPHLSRVLARLENELGATLFERRSRGLQLTAEGRRLHHATTQFFAQSELVRSALFPKDAALEGPVALGAATWISGYWLAPKIPRMLQTAPRLELNVASGTTPSLCEDVRSGRLDMAFLFFVPKAESRGLSVRTVGSITACIVGSPEAKASSSIRRRFVGSKSLEDSRANALPAVEKIKKQEGSVEIFSSSNDLMIHRAIALAGLGVASLPEAFIAQELRSGTLTRIYPGHSMEWKILQITRTQQKRNTQNPRLLKIQELLSQIDA